MELEAFQHACTSSIRVKANQYGLQTQQNDESANVTGTVRLREPVGLASRNSIAD